MTEELLHYIWKFQLYNHNGLKTTSGECVEVHSSGMHNQNAGPDFFNSQLKIGNTKWAGNTEIHIKSSDWFKHNHQEDPSYNKIILHVVWEDDKPVHYNNGEPIPTILLKGRVSQDVMEKYSELKAGKKWIPCEAELEKVDALHKLQSMDQNLVERMIQKSNRIHQILALTKNDWEATLYIQLAKYFGFKINAVPFELLASSIHISIIRKLRFDEKKLTALYFGQAGLLNEDLKGSYPQELLKEYNFLKAKFKLQPLDASVWKFMRMRPANFPTIRLAQFIHLLHKNVNLFQRLISEPDLNKLRVLFDAKADKYWNSHFRFDVPASRNEVKVLGESSVDILLINVLIPMLFVYGETHGNEELKKRALNFLQSIPPESNQIIKKWKALHFPVKSAYDTQALIQLKSVNCSAKNCLNCTIGSYILKRENK